MTKRLGTFLARGLFFLSKRLDRAAVDPSSAECFFALLATTGYQPKTVLDIGANRGGWTRQALEFFPDAEYYLFEPQVSLREYHDRLEQAFPNVSVYYCGAGRETGTMMLSINSERDDSSTFRLNADEATEQGFQQEELAVVGIDDFLRDKGISKADVLKIDAEGLDLEVLEGSKDALSRSDYVFVECAILNKNFENTLIEVVTRMDRVGFKLVDFTDLNRTARSKALWLVEAVFCRKGAGLDAIVASYRD